MTVCGREAAPLAVRGQLNLRLVAQNDQLNDLVLVSREVKGEDQRIGQTPLVVILVLANFPRPDAIPQLSGGTERGRRSEPTAT